ncbi:MAG: FkbM family methyltransferase [Candidatus Methylacidiphilales bacterium]|nr:FkbM family methyltransferase [Candidatus Methylacidiphilales bacterium]
MSRKLFSGLESSFRFLVGHEGFSSHPLRCVWRVFAWYLLVLTGRNPTMKVGAWNASYLLPSVFRSPAKVFYVFGRDYEPEIKFLESYLREGDVFVDGGANFGLYTIMAARHLGSAGRVFAFEPFPESHELVVKNIDRNRLDNVELFQVALSDENGEARLGVHDDPGRNSLALDASETIATVKVEKKRLDDLWAQHRFPLPTVIKLDVEGHERSILLGALKTLSAATPTIIFELIPPSCERAGHTVGALIDLLRDAGYTFFAFSGNKMIPAIPECGDYIAVHTSRLTEDRNIRMQNSSW